MKRQYSDPERLSWDTKDARPLNALVWYPAAAGTVEKEWTVAIFEAGSNAQGAPMSPTPAKLPLVVLSHGTGGSAVGLSWLAQYLAQHGFIVAAVNHHGNTAAESNARIEGTLVWWDRAQDMNVLIDRLLADPWIGPRIDTNRIGVAGFSIGGYTALATVGVRLSRSQFDTYCAVQGNCELPPEMSARYTKADALKLMHDDARLNHALERMEDSYEDKRIRAAFVMAPVVGFAMTQQSLQSVHVPVHIVVGKDDDQALPEANARPMTRQIPAAILDVLPAGGHYMFLPTCTDRGKNFVKDICEDAPGIDRTAIHAKINADALSFFRQTLDL
jgi:predicted dienelactone hydrolase